jgi:hypothetical protein
VRRISYVFEKKKKGEKLTKGGTGPWSSTKTRHPLPSDWTLTRGAGTSSSSGRTMTGGTCGTGTSSSSSRTVVVSACDSETSSSTTHMHFALGTSSSSYITCVANWSAWIGPSWRWWLDSPDGAMAMVEERCWWGWVSTNESTGSVWLERCPYL